MISHFMTFILLLLLVDASIAFLPFGKANCNCENNGDCQPGAAPNACVAKGNCRGECLGQSKKCNLSPNKCSFGNCNDDSDCPKLPYNKCYLENTCKKGHWCNFRTKKCQDGM